VKSIPDFREENLYPLWENFCNSKIWSEDLRLRGLIPGKLNLSEGPDFQGAEFELDGKIYHGDIEIHRQTNDWYRHYHHLDRRYNSVRLHLVWHVPPERIVRTSDGRTVLTLDIKKLFGTDGYHEKKPSCKISAISSVSHRERLKILSLKRLNYKITRIKDLVKSNSYDQLLFSLLMRILGSPNNATNFEYLASLLSWEEMTLIKKKHPLSSDHWAKFYLHLSGLKPDKSNPIDNSEYFPFINLIKRTSPISYLSWQISGQRPQNNPIRHLTILANWFSQFSNESLYFTLKEIITQRLSAVELIVKLNSVLSPGLSKSKYSSVPEGEKTSSPQWGRSKTIEIIGNAIIPLFYWEASVNSSFGFQKYLEEFYFSLPQFNQYSKLDKFRRLSVKDDPLDKKFYVNQGLLHVHQNYCSKRTCHLCPLAGQIKDIDKNF